MQSVMLLLGLLVVQVTAFQSPTRNIRSPPRAASSLQSLRCSDPTPEPETPETPETPELTKVGSKAYYEGFFSQPVDENVTIERGDGTEQAVKFAASSTAVIVALFVGFMASNGLIG